MIKFLISTVLSLALNAETIFARSTSVDATTKIQYYADIKLPEDFSPIENIYGEESFLMDDSGLTFLFDSGRKSIMGGGYLRPIILAVHFYGKDVLLEQSEDHLNSFAPHIPETSGTFFDGKEKWAASLQDGDLVVDKAKFFGDARSQMEFIWGFPPWMVMPKENRLVMITSQKGAFRLSAIYWPEQAKDSELLVQLKNIASSLKINRASIESKLSL